MTSPARPRRIFLTGASGLLGGEIAGRLIDRGHQVTALVHTRREVRRNNGELLPATDWPVRAPGAVALVTGDVALLQFGCDTDQAAAVAGEHDLLLHCAAATGFDLDAATYQRVNVDGTANSVEIARRGGMPLLYVSTAYVWGQRDGPAPETAIDGTVVHTNGYEASKAEAEAIVRRSGLAHAIARPSIIVGDHADGAIRVFDTFHIVFRLLARGRVRALPASPHASLDMVPLDHVAAGLIDLTERVEEADGGTFHLVSGAPVSVTRFRDAIAAWPQFHQPQLVDPTAFDPAGLSATERRLHERVLSLYASYFRHDPHFLDERTRQFTGRACPPTDDAFLHRLAAFAVRAGFVPGEGAAA